MSLGSRATLAPAFHTNPFKPVAAMPAQPESKFPNRLAYVLKLRSDARRDAIAGRLENLVTGQRLEFESGRELLDAIAREIDSSSSDVAAD
jgi:hypothetical protein